MDWDDEPNFLLNESYRGLGWTQLKWMFTAFHLGHYAPLTWITFGADYLVWGLDPLGYHLTNLLLHTANAVVFYLIAFRLLQGGIPGATDRPLPLRLSAALAALVFAVHPLRVESVAWATERRDVLSGLFYLLAVLVYLRREQDSSGGPAAGAGSTGPASCSSSWRCSRSPWRSRCPRSCSCSTSIPSAASP